MTNRLVSSARRFAEFVGCVATAAALLFPASGYAFSWADDDDRNPGQANAEGNNFPGEVRKGIPLELSRRSPSVVQFLSAGQVGADDINCLGFTVVPDLGYPPSNRRVFSETLLCPDFTDFFAGDNSGGNVSTIEAFLRLNHPRISDLEIILGHIDDQNQTTMVSLMTRNGCTGFDESTVFDQDISVLFTDAAPSEIDSACDRNIPTMAGRQSPTNRVCTFCDPTLVERSLNTFNGVPIRATWFLVIRDYGAGENRFNKGALVDLTLVINGNTEADTAPREETPTGTPAQSGNNIVTETDYVANAFHLLGIYNLDQRMLDDTPLDLRNVPDVNLSGDNEDDYVNFRRSSAVEFSKLDSAPAGSSGDGIVSVADFVQSSRYAASLDELSNTDIGPLSRNDRMIFSRILGGPTLIRESGQETAVSVMLRTKDAETEVGFGLEYDDTLLEFLRIERGDCVPENAIFQVNRNFDTDPGLIGLRVGVEPDETFICDFSDTRPILGTGDPSVPFPPTLEAVIDDGETRPYIVSLPLTLTNEGITFPSDDSGVQVVTLRVGVQLSQQARVSREIFQNIDSFQVTIGHLIEKLDLIDVVDADFPGTFSNFQSFDSDGYQQVIINGTKINDSVFTEGTLFFADYQVIAGVNNGNIQEPSLQLPSVRFFFQDEEYFNPGAPLSKFFEATLDDTATADEIDTPLPIIAGMNLNVNRTFNGDAVSACDGRDIRVDINVGQNIRSVTRYRATIRHDARYRLAGNLLNDPDIIDADSEFNGSISILSRIESGDTATTTFESVDEDAYFLNGRLETLEFETEFNTLPPDAELVFELTQFRLSEFPNKAVLLQDNCFIVDCEPFNAPANPDLNNQPKPCSTKSDEVVYGYMPPKSEASSSLEVAQGEEKQTDEPELFSFVQGVEDEGDGTFRLTIDSYMEVPAGSPTVTNYRYYLTYDSSQITPDFGSVSGGVFGVTPFVDTFDVSNDPLFALPNPPSSVYRTLVIDGRSSAGLTPNGLPQLLNRFEFTGDLPIINPRAIHFTSKPPRNQNIEIAKVFFRARPGVGTVATPLRYGPNPFADGLAARNPLGAPVYTSFIDSAVTVIDPVFANPEVRVVDTILSADAEGNVLVALESVGEENAAGFTINFDTDDLTLLSAGPGRDVPSDAFFFANPNVNDISVANQTGQMSFLVGLQPGNEEGNNRSFEVGTNVLVNLRFRTRQLEASELAENQRFVTTQISLSELADRREVVDVNAIALQTDWKTGEIGISSGECEYTLNPASAEFDPLGNAGSFTVTADSGCPWVATSTDEWIVVDNEGIPNFAEVAQVTYTVLPNSGGSRSGSIEVGGQVFSIAQEGCTYNITPERLTFPGVGGTGEFAVSTEETCNFEVDPIGPDGTVYDWITITSSQFNTGPGTVSFIVDQNVGGERIGFIRISGGDTPLFFEVDQRICTYALTPPVSEELSPAGDSGSFEIQTDEFCPWEVNATVEWIVITSAVSGNGDGTITFDVVVNPSDTRVGFISVSDQLEFRVTQAGNVDCEYTLIPTQRVFTGSGGDGVFTIDANEDVCPWEVSVDVPWIQITSATSGAGDREIQFAVEENDGPTREGVITVAEQELRVRQFGENQFVFDFINSEDGWESFSVLGDVTPEYDPGGDPASSGRLILRTADNTNTFGFWSAPTLRLDDPVSGDENQVFLATYQLSSDVTDDVSVPVIRLRVSSEDFNMTNEYWVISEGTGSFSPSAESEPFDRRLDYRHVYTLPPNIDEFRLFFDVLNFVPADAANAAVALESVVIQPATFNVGGVQEEAFFSNAMNRSEFLSGFAGEFEEPSFIVSSRGIGMAAKDRMNVPEKTIFGFWSLPTDIQVEENRVYRATFRVSARSSMRQTVLKSRVPPFRLRINSSSQRHASVLNVDSRDNESFIPTVTEPVEYDVFLTAQSPLVQDSLIFSFDLLIPANSEDDPSVELVLESLLIRSYDLPETED